MPSLRHGLKTLMGALPLFTGRLLLFLVALGTLSSLVQRGDAAPEISEANIDDSVVNLHVSKRQVDASAPWQFESARQESSLAIFVGEDLFLTTAWAIADGVFLQLQRLGDSRKFEAEVAFVDYEVNLALVRPKLPAAVAGLRPLPLGEDIAVGGAVDVFKARDSYQMTRLSATLQEVSTFTAATSTYAVVAYLLKVQQAGLGWAEPVTANGKLVALTTGQDNNHVHAVPAVIIRHFMADVARNDGYRGFPAMGVSLSPLVSPEMRRMLKADTIQGGVRIAQIVPSSSLSGRLMVDDVLMTVDDIRVSEHGFFAHPKWGKVHLRYLLNQHFAGDVVRLMLLRDGKQLTLEAPLERYRSNAAPVHAYLFGEPAPHVIFGGLLLQELSRPYLQQWGKGWEDAAPLPLLHTLEFDNEAPEKGLRRIVFLTRIVADEFNRGYGGIENSLVESVNGRPVHSLDDVRAALNHPISSRGREYARVVLRRDDGEIVLDYDGVKAAHERMAHRYEIPSSSFFVRQRDP